MGILSFCFVLLLPLQARAAGPFDHADKLADERKLQAALDETNGILAGAHDEALKTEALLRATGLEIALGGFETAVKKLREHAWPKSGPEHALVELYYVYSLMSYYENYSWEINQREKTSANGDLRAMTTAELAQEMGRAFDEAMKSGPWLDQPVPAFFHDYISGNTYPREVRPSLRDSITYLATKFFLYDQFWSAAESNGLYRLSVTRLVSMSGERISAAAVAVHPLERAASWLTDLEREHAKRGETEAALEARYQLYEGLRQSLRDESDRAAVLSALKATQAKADHVRWWARGQEMLAEFLRGTALPEREIEARREAAAGAAEFPKTQPGEACAAIVERIDQPQLGLRSMLSDSGGKRSVLLRYRNTRKAYLRAYRIDFDQELKGAKGGDFLGDTRTRLQELLKAKTPAAAAWSVDLDDTKDFLDHRHFVTPPPLPPGFYLLASSLREDFSEALNIVDAAPFLASSLVLGSRSLANGAVEARVVEAGKGAPVAGASIELYSFDWSRPPRLLKSLKADAQGYALFAHPTGAGTGFFLVARHAHELALDRENIYFASPQQQAEIKSAFVYTDRSIYRPSQKIQFKVVAYSGVADTGRYHVAKAGTALKVRLVDSNNETVATRELKLGSFGSAAGEFEVPVGRALGAWSLQAVGVGGYAGVRVEEYKRPTFEATFLDAKGPLRLNRTARLHGEARYYFGLPVTEGKVSWRVVRRDVRPWGFWGWWRQRDAETVASGNGTVDKSGSFEIAFDPKADERAKIQYDFTVVADVTDEGGETRTAERVFRLGFASLAAKLDWTEGFFRPGENAVLHASLATLDGKPLAGAGHFKLSRLAAPAAVAPAELPRDDFERTKFTHADDLRRARWETGFRWEEVTHAWKESDLIAEGDVSHDAKGDGKIELKMPAKGGVYRLSYRTKDGFGEYVDASRDFLVSGEGAPGLPLVAVAEKSSVEAGGTARFLIASGLVGQPLSVEIFAGGKRRSRKNFAGGMLEVPVTAADRGGFTVVAEGVRDHQAMRAEVNEEVPWSDRELRVAFSTFRDKLHPGEKETLKISVKSSRGPALERGGAEVLAYMYDRSLDLFGPHVPPSVASLYQGRTGAPGAFFALGEAPSSRLYASIPYVGSPPEPSPDAFVYNLRYGIGGPGGRHGRMEMIYEDAAMGEESGAATPRSASRAAPAMAMIQEEAKSLPPPAAATPIRANFAESAFFAPHLLVDANGTASVEFTAPDSVTGWRVLAHALTKDLRGGSASRETRTVKELMVRPYAPRFLREGDSADVRVQVNNDSGEELAGELSFDVEESGKNVSDEFGLARTRAPFRVAAGGSATVSFALRAPKKTGDYSFRATARAGVYSDGELRPFPVLPSRLHLTQSRFAALHGKESKTLEFADLSVKDATRINERIAVTVDAQLFYGLLEALPYLVNYPYECVEQTLNRFLSTGILSSLYGKFPAVGRMAKELSARDTRFERFDQPDVNRGMGLEETPWLEESKGGAGGLLAKVLDPAIAKMQKEKALAKLAKAQLPSGAFPWFQGGPPDEYITLYVLLSLSRALEFKVEVPRPLVAKAWNYVHGWLAERLGDMMARDSGWELTTLVHFALTSYPDDSSWIGKDFDDAFRAKLLDFSFKHWKEHSPLLKGYLALSLKRANREKDARLVWDSVMDSAKQSDELGTYWAREDRSWLWYNDEIDTHAFALRVQLELNPGDKRNAGLAQWLFLNKKLNHWKSTRATAEVIYALTHYLDRAGEPGVPEDVRVEAGGRTTEMHFDPKVYTGKKNQIVVPGPKVAPPGEIRVSKTSPGLAFASATWAFSTEKMPEEERGDFFQVSRRYFKRVPSGAGFELQPLADGAKLAVGDELEVRLSLRTKHEAEYVHLRDPRGAGFEPENVSSGWKWDLGISWYEETRDSGSNFFFSRLPVGEYDFHYRLRASMSGTFRVGPATVQSMYAPEFNAYSAGNAVEIR